MKPFIEFGNKCSLCVPLSLIKDAELTPAQLADKIESNSVIEITSYNIGVLYRRELSDIKGEKVVHYYVTYSGDIRSDIFAEGVLMTLQSILLKNLY